ncbi:MAG: peptidoglycan-binding protein [Oscillospiraceae bacterium]|nr:peptidoglycan-binding protein [Oscillospiraceae bacterium]
MTILLYNNDTNRMERFERDARDPMPYADSSLLVGEFRGTSRSQLLWTQRRTMDSWVSFRRIWGQPIYVRHCFRRVGEGGHANQSQHYAGTAFDCAHNLSSAQRAQMRASAQSSGLWTYVEPAYLTPTWVHFDTRTLPPACFTGGYPLTRRGSVGVYVLILQDALNIVTRAGLGLDGMFGVATEDAVGFFQATRGLTADGIVGCVTWQLLTNSAVGAGFSPYA